MRKYLEIVVGGPQGCGKTETAQLILEALGKAGYSAEVLTTNVALDRRHAELHGSIFQADKRTERGKD